MELWPQARPQPLTNRICPRIWPHDGRLLRRRATISDQGDGKMTTFEIPEVMRYMVMAHTSDPPEVHGIARLSIRSVDLLLGLGGVTRRKAARIGTFNSLRLVGRECAELALPCPF